MNNELKALEDQFNDLASGTFDHLRQAETSLAKVRENVQRMFSIQSSLSKVRGGKHNAGRSSSFGKALKSLLATVLIAASAPAADYPFLVQTNLAKMLGPSVQWRPCMEPEEFRVVSTNWSLALPAIADTNGISTYHEVGTIITNVTLRFTWKGKVCVCPYGQDVGPIVGIRPTVLPAPLPTPLLQLRKK